MYSLLQGNYFRLQPRIGFGLRSISEIHVHTRATIPRPDFTILQLNALVFLHKLNLDQTNLEHAFALHEVFLVDCFVL